MDYHPLPDHLVPGLQVLFVGYNPSLRSSEAGHHFASPSNRFWKILHQAGITPRLYTALEDYRLPELGYGLTNIVARPTRAAAEIGPVEYQIGRQELYAKIDLFRPRAVCFVGKGVYLAYAEQTAAPWGFQEKEAIAGVRDFVAPSSSGLVRMNFNQVVDIYRMLLNPIT